VQEVVPTGTQYERALEMAKRISAQAPLAVQAALANAKLALRDGDGAAAEQLQPELVRLVQTEDSKIGMQAFLSRGEAHFVGH
jgi:enoyl-CoA hydratase